jgi:hypothetical protein
MSNTMINTRNSKKKKTKKKTKKTPKNPNPDISQPTLKVQDKDIRNPKCNGYCDRSMHLMQQELQGEQSYLMER